MPSQKQPRITTGNPLDTSETTSNVATNRAELEALRAANIDGKDVYPNTLTTKHLNADNGTFQGYMKAGSLLVGSGGVSISSATEGATPTTGLLLTGSILQLIKSSVAQVTLDGTTGDATFKGTIASGSTISATMTAGSIFVGSGGVSISSAAAGAEPTAAGLFMGITGGAPQIYLKNGAGAVTVRLNGSDGSAYFAGQVVTSNIQITDSASNTANLQSGTIYLGTSITVGAAGSGRTLGDTARTFYQTTAPVAGMLTGDIWVDSDDPNLTTWRYNGSNWTTQTVGTVNHTYYQSAAPSSGMVTGDIWVDSDDLKMWRYNGTNWTTQQVANINTTFAQTAAPTALAAGDIWVDTNDGNKMYRATAAGSGSWVALLDAVQADGTYVVLDSNNYITRINTTNGIVISTTTADSGARTQITSAGIDVYNSAGNDIVSIAGSKGIDIYNANDPPLVTERLSLLGAAVTGVRSAGAEGGMLFASNGVKGGTVLLGYSEPLFIGGGLTYSGSVWSWDNDECEISAGDFIKLLPGMNASGADTVYVGDATYTGKKLAVYGNIEFNDDDGTKPMILSGAVTWNEGDASGYPAGTFFLGTGGSIWVANSGGQWNRIRTYAYNP